LFENKDGEDQYGNSGYVVQSISKEAKEAGEKGPIIGNWKADKRAPRAQAQQSAAQQPQPDSDDGIPF